MHNGGASAEEPEEEPRQGYKPEEVRVLSPEEFQAKKREKLKGDGMEVVLSNGGVATILGREIVGTNQELFVIAVGDRDIVAGKRWLKENLDPESEVDYDNVPLIHRASKPKKSSTEQEDKQEQPGADDSKDEPELSDERKKIGQSTSV